MNTPKLAKAGPANILRNFGWILGGKGFGAIASLAYLAVLTRTLGLEDFGQFALIFGFSQAIIAFVSFQSWQIIVRFGTVSTLAANWSSLGRLIGLCSTLDIAAAIVGCLIAYLVCYQFAYALNISPELLDICFLFTCALLWARMSTPSGVVRLMNRFDIGTYVEAIVPFGRLVGAIIVAFTVATVERFLLLWAIIDLCAMVLYWWSAYRLAPTSFAKNNLKNLRMALEEHNGVIRFSAVTYASATIDTAMRQGPLLFVGATLGTESAGIYRIADQLAQGISKASVFAARAIFPDLSAMHHAEGTLAVSKAVRKLTLAAVMSGLLLTLIAWIVGSTLISIIGGSEYKAAASVLIPLVIAASIELAAVAFEPMLYATGYATRALAARLAAGIALATGLSVMTFGDPTLISWAVAFSMGIYFVAIFTAVRSTLSVNSV